MGESKDDVVERRWRFDDRPPISRCFIFDDAGVFLAVIPILIVDAPRPPRRHPHIKMKSFFLLFSVPLVCSLATRHCGPAKSTPLTFSAAASCRQSRWTYSTLLYSTLLSLARITATPTRAISRGQTNGLLLECPGRHSSSFLRNSFLFFYFLTGPPSQSLSSSGNADF